MGEPTFTRKVYICSRQAADTSRSTSDFDICLSRNLVLPQRCAGFITDIHIPHAWRTIDNGHCFLYYRLFSASLGLNEQFAKVELAKGNYTGAQLAVEIRLKVAASLATMTGVTGLQFYIEHVSSLQELQYSLSPAFDF